MPFRVPVRVTESNVRRHALEIAVGTWHVRNCVVVDPDHSLFVCIELVVDDHVGYNTVTSEESLYLLAVVALAVRCSISILVTDEIMFVAMPG